MTNKTVATLAVGLTLILGGAGCSSTPASTTDSKQGKMSAEAGTFNAQAMVGTWKGQVTGADEITLKDDGTFTSVLNNKEWSKGTWKVVDNTLTLEDPDFIVNGVLKNATLSGDTFKATDENLGDETWTRVN